MCGTPYLVIHKTVKAAAPKGGPKDADADWDIVDMDELSVGKEEIRSMYTLRNHQFKHLIDSTGTPAGKTVDKEPNDDYVIVPTSRKGNITRFAGSELQACTKLATLS